jgi:hypothetical protein
VVIGPVTRERVATGADISHGEVVSELRKVALGVGSNATPNQPRCFDDATQDGCAKLAAARSNFCGECMPPLQVAGLDDELASFQQQVESAAGPSTWVSSLDVLV